MAVQGTPKHLGINMKLLTSFSLVNVQYIVHLHSKTIRKEGVVRAASAFSYLSDGFVTLVAAARGRTTHFNKQEIIQVYRSYFIFMCLT